MAAHCVCIFEFGILAVFLLLESPRRVDISRVPALAARGNNQNSCCAKEIFYDFIIKSEALLFYKVPPPCPRLHQSLAQSISPRMPWRVSLL